jgi:hypothetical protein
MNDEYEEIADFIIEAIIGVVIPIVFIYVAFGWEMTLGIVGTYLLLRL